MQLSLDTNCILRWVLNDNEEQATLVSNVLSSNSSKIGVADLSLIEAVWVLRRWYNYSEGQAVDILRIIIEHPNINCNTALFELVLDEIQQSPAISLTDICLMFYAKLTNSSKLLTFDKKFAKRFPDTVKLLTPSK